MQCIKIPSEDFIFIGEKIESMANKFIFAPLKTTLSAMRILSYINSKKTITAKELIHLTGKSKSNITQRLNILEKNGLIERIRDSNIQDKREIYLKITPLGKEKTKEALKRIKKFHISKEELFSPAELQRHIHFMKKLSIFLDKKEEELKKIFNQQ